MKLAKEKRAGPGSGCPLIVHLTVGGGCPSVRHASCIASSAAATTSLGGLPSSQRGGPVPYHTNLHICLIAEQRCKKKFTFFFILVTFFTSLTFFQTFLFKKNVGKVQSGKQIHEKHFQNNSNEIDLWFLCCMSNDLKCLPINFYLLTMFDACLNGISRVALKTISWASGVELNYTKKS